MVESGAAQELLQQTAGAAGNAAQGAKQLVIYCKLHTPVSSPLSNKHRTLECSTNTNTLLAAWARTGNNPGMKTYEGNEQIEEPQAHCSTQHPAVGNSPGLFSTEWGWLSALVRPLSSSPHQHNSHDAPCHQPGHEGQPAPCCGQHSAAWGPAQDKACVTA